MRAVSVRRRSWSSRREPATTSNETSAVACVVSARTIAWCGPSNDGSPLVVAACPTASCSPAPASSAPPPAAAPTLMKPRRESFRSVIGLPSVRAQRRLDLEPVRHELELFEQTTRRRIQPLALCARERLQRNPGAVRPLVRLQLLAQMRQAGLHPLHEPRAAGAEDLRHRGEREVRALD